METRWTNAQAVYRMLQIYTHFDDYANETDIEFVARKFATISVYGSLRYNCDGLMIWEDAHGNLAFIDHRCEAVGVFYAGFTYCLPSLETAGNSISNSYLEVSV